MIIARFPPWTQKFEYQFSKNVARFERKVLCRNDLMIIALQLSSTIELLAALFSP